MRLPQQAYPLIDGGSTHHSGELPTFPAPQRQRAERMIMLQIGFECPQGFRVECVAKFSVDLRLGKMGLAFCQINGGNLEEGQFFAAQPMIEEQTHQHTVAPPLWRLRLID